MIKESKTLLSNCSGLISFEGQPTQAIAYYSNETNKRTNTISIHTANFTGRIYVYGTVKLNPSDNDWSIIQLEEGVDYLEFDNLGHPKHLQENFVYNIDGAYTWLKAKMDRSYISEFQNLPEYFKPYKATTRENVLSWYSNPMSDEYQKIPNNDRVCNALRNYGNVEKIMLCY